MKETRFVKSGSDNYGAALRGDTANPDNNCYVATVAINSSPGSPLFRVMQWAPGNSFQGELVRIDISEPQPDDWLGFAVNGIGAATEFKYWRFGPSDPGDYSAWGAPTAQQIINPASPLDTGKFIGVSNYSSGSASNNTKDQWHWEGGDQ